MSHVLAHFMYHLNKHRPEPTGWKSNKPCKIVYVGHGISVDKRHLGQFSSPNTPEKYSDKQRILQEALGMPSLASPDVPPNHETGNTYKPYVYIDGILVHGKNGLLVTIGSDQQATYENGKVSPFKGAYERKIVKEGYGADGITVGQEYRKLKILQLATETTKNGRAQIKGTVSEDTMNKLCNVIFDLCKKATAVMGKTDDASSDDKIPPTRIAFRILVIPETLKNLNITHEPQNSNGITGIDSFGNAYSKIPSTMHKSATYSTIDDMAYVLNPTSAKKDHTETTRYWKSHPVIGNCTFEKIGLRLQDDFYDLAGLKWYFGSHDLGFKRERHASDTGLEHEAPYRANFKQGIWYQLYDSLKNATASSTPISEMLIICVKRSSIARVEVVLCESVTTALLQKSLLIGNVPIEESEFNDKLKHTHKALENVLLTPDKNPDWSMYMECVSHILSGKKLNQKHLVQYITSNFREFYTRKKWKNLKNKHECSRFLKQAKFVVAALATPHNNGKGMDTAEEYAYRIGKIVGIYATYTKTDNVSSLGLQPGMTCNRLVLHGAFCAVMKTLSHMRVSPDLANTLKQIKLCIPSNEIERGDWKRDLTLHFYLGFFEEAAR